MSDSRTLSEQRKPSSARPTVSSRDRTSLHPILRLQQTAGNRAVARLQAKLTVSSPDDIYEQEADRVAASVMRLIGPAAGSGGMGDAPIQRQPMEEEEELLQPRRGDAMPSLQRQEEEEELAMPRRGAAMPTVQRQEEEELAMPRRGDAIPAIQRQEEEEELLMPRRGDTIPTIQRQEDDELVWMRPAMPVPAVRHQASAEGLGGLHSQPTSEVPRGEGRAAVPESSTPAVTSTMASRLAGGRGGGQALDRGVRVELEEALGFDFGGVRIHTETSADELAGQVRAEAFTHAGDIYFRAGRYQPGTENGRFLLAHELAHVIQQGAAGPRRGAGPRDPDATEFD